jgi:Amt family ammonium transporter
VTGNWVHGGGWLANLGTNLGLGHGFVDFAGSSVVHLVGASVAAAAILIFLPRRSREADTASAEPVPLPPIHLPVFAVLGAVLVLLGSVAWCLSNPLLELSSLQAARVGANLALAACAGGLLPLCYTWFVSSRPDPLMSVRGLAAAVIAACAAGPFVTPVAALLLGGIVGAVVPLVCYLVDHVLRWDDPAAALPVHGLGAVLGLVAVGLLSDGASGQGWNGIGIAEYLGVPGQGVSALWVSQGMAPDWPGQLAAQGIGLLAVVLFAFGVAGLVFGPLAAVAALGRSRGENVGLDADRHDAELISAPDGLPIPLPQQHSVAATDAEGGGPGSPESSSRELD